MIKAEGLTRKYGDFVAVDGVSFEIGSNEIVGLLGHNGAGKTSIMKMVTGYLEPSSGLTEIDGVDVWSKRAQVQRYLGYLPENCPVYPEMEVLQYLDYAAVLRGVPAEKKSERLRYVLEKTNLSKVAKKAIATLSRGYRQRLGVAQALLNSPRILILDEPTNGLDPSQILEMRSLIKELAEYATIVLSTHILQEVQAVCSRVIIINSGKVALDADISNLQLTGRLRLLTDAQTSLCKEILETLGMKLLESKLKDSLFEHIVEAPAQSAAMLNRAFVEKGCSVYALHPLVRDLESIFGEISTGNGKTDSSVQAETKQRTASEKFSGQEETNQKEKRDPELEEGLNGGAEAHRETHSPSAEKEGSSSQ